MVEFNVIPVKDADFKNGFMEIACQFEIIKLCNDFNGYPEILVRKDVIPSGKKIIYFHPMNTQIDNLVGTFIGDLFKFGSHERFVVYQINQFHENEKKSVIWLKIASY